MERRLGVYVHLPFCLRKCDYCDFYSIPYDKAKAAQYRKAVERQMEEYGVQTTRYQCDSVYFGGGTPTLLPTGQLRSLLRQVDRQFHLQRTAEVTVETNPAVKQRRKLKALRAMGVNRLSIGLQSAHDEELRTLGRLHTVAEFEETYRDAVAARFANISVDLMFGIPGQTLQSFEETLDYVLALSPRPQHISCYGLKIEEGTPFYQRRESLELPDEDSEADMYFLACRKLREAGYSHYEISNFAVRGYESRHNLKYWSCEEYLGFGAAAASYFGNQRFTVVRDIALYEQRLADGGSYMSEISTEPYDVIAGDYIMLRLRTMEGVSYAQFLRRFKRDLKTVLGGREQRYLESGHMADTGMNLHLTEKGFYVSNYILADLLRCVD